MDDDRASRGRPEPREPSSRQRILDAALRLFGREGYEETSVAELARAAEVSKGLVYHYFDTKRDVLEAVMARGTERLEAALARDGTGRAPAAPAALVMEVLGLVAEDLLWWRLFFRLRMHPDLGRHSGIASRGRSLEEALERSLGAAGAAEPRRQARALAAAIEGTAQRYVLDPDDYPLVNVAEAIVSAHVPPP